MPVGALRTSWKVLASIAFSSAILDHRIWPRLVAHRPALQRGDHVLGGDRLAIVELEPVAQGEGPGELVVAHLPRVDHLRLDLELAVQCEQRVVDHVTVVAHDEGGGPDRVEDFSDRSAPPPEASRVVVRWPRPAERVPAAAASPRIRLRMHASLFFVFEDHHLPPCRRS